MATYPYLIIGGGMTGDAAVKGIRQLDQRAAIGLIGAEPEAPYARPPLSKALWKGESEDTIWRKTAEAGVEMHLGRRIVSLDLAHKQVVDDAGTAYGFGKLLLATGGSPRRLAIKDRTAEERMIYYRTVEDYRRLRALAAAGKSFVVIGGGFIGSEIAAALALQNCRVTMVFPEPGIGGRLFPNDLAMFLNEYYRDHNVDVRPRELVGGVRASGAGVEVQLKDGTSVQADAVVAGLGIMPNTDLAQEAGLPVQDGIIVDEHLRAGHPDVLAAGDIARFSVPSFEGRMRVEHEDNAVTMGGAAGRAMAGDTTPYTHLPFFYSDLFDLGYEAVGEMDPKADIVADWKEPHREGVVYYLVKGRVRGVLLWGIFGQVDHARALIAEPGPFRPSDLKGRLPAR